MAKFNEVAERSKQLNKEKPKSVNVSTVNAELKSMSDSVLEYFKDSPAICIRTADQLHEYIDKCIEASGMKVEDIDYLIPHQANQRIIEALQSRLKYSDEKVISNIKYYGNTSAASIPIALVEGVEKGKIKLGSTAILCGFGAGMTWGAAVVRLREGIC